MTHEQRLAIIRELERQQMMLPRGLHIQPNLPIDAIAAGASAIIGEVEPGSDEYIELVDSFTWGLAESD